MGSKFQYYLLDAGRAWRRKGKAAKFAAFFFAFGNGCRGKVNDAPN